MTFVTSRSMLLRAKPTRLSSSRVSSCLQGSDPLHEVPLVKSAALTNDARDRLCTGASASYFSQQNYIKLSISTWVVVPSYDCILYCALYKQGCSLCLITVFLCSQPLTPEGTLSWLSIPRPVPRTERVLLTLLDFYNLDNNVRLLELHGRVLPVLGIIFLAELFCCATLNNSIRQF